MQTFLPYADFTESAKTLDRLRLGKQRVEAKQICLSLASQSTSGWRNHPAVLMWKGYERALASYGLAMCREWKNRGYQDSLESWFVSLIKDANHVALPPWLGNEEFHRSHRSNLLRKNREWYGRFGWTELDSLPYIWPVRKC